MIRFCNPTFVHPTAFLPSLINQLFKLVTAIRLLIKPLQAILQKKLFRTIPTGARVQ